ncbi:MAG: metallophosphoesterase [Clostridia bacterium]|nr:metallophosphoesterase [Clostridia bacterium]
MISLIKKQWQLIAAFLVICVILLIFIIYSNFTVQTTQYTVTNEKIPDSFNNFKIVQISDLHNTLFGSSNEKLLESIQKEKPDVIFITGDSVDRFNTDIDISLQFAENAMKICDIYFVPGNHELSIETEIYEKYITRLSEAGVKILKDENTFIEKNSEKILITGINDASAYKTEFGEKYIDKTTEKINSLNDEAYFSILLAHHPELFPEYAKTNIDLVFSGHAHGGQFRLPLIGGIIAPEQGLFPEYDSGIFNENNTTMVVSRGLGNSIIPLRINNPPEIVSVTLKNRQ